MAAGSVAAPQIVPLRAPVVGKAKNIIDTDTKIELYTATPNTDIYYTTNNTKPDPWQPLGTGDRVTMKYKKPITLPEGRRTLKAVAVSKDGVRESNIVTKVFEVEYVEPDYPDGPGGDDGLSFQEDLEKVERKERAKNNFMKKLLAKSAWNEDDDMRSTQRKMTDLHIGGSKSRKPRTGPRFMNTRMGQPSDNATIGQDTRRSDDFPMNGHTEHEVVQYPRRRPPDNATQAMRLQRETDFMKCVYCFAPRPTDPFARFCNDCGNPVPPIPQTRLPPTEGGQIGMCVYCHTMVPFNTTHCVICESPIPPQNQAQASLRLSEKLVCGYCSTANPSHIQQCLTCEGRLSPNKSIFHGMSAPPLPRQDGQLVSCTKCGRVNNPDARFCDWCGAKPSPSMGNLICSKCHASNQPYAKYCTSCGVTIEPPFRKDPRNSGATINGAQTDNLGHSTSAQWLPVSYPISPKMLSIQTAPKATQTVGLYYPSEREIIRKKHEEEDRLAMEKQMRDRRPLLTAISPGRGYWRKQMEHICTHLKAHAQNDAEFRALVGEPRMGKILSAAVHEDGYELSLNVNFILRGDKDIMSSTKLNLMRDDPREDPYLEYHRNARRDSVGTADQESIASERSVPEKKPKKKKVVKKSQKKKKEVEDKLTVEDRALLREVGKNGEGRVNEVTQLIDEGADPNCTNKDGVPVLHVATVNNHANVIPVLVQEGVDVNVKGPNKGNTALHEAVKIGYSAMEVVEALLGCGANPNKKNDKGETAYDLAVKNNEDKLVKKFASHMGQNTLDKMIRPKSPKKMDIF